VANPRAGCFLSGILQQLGKNVHHHKAERDRGCDMQNIAQMFISKIAHEVSSMVRLHSAWAEKANTPVLAPESEN
jgi:hypothetical protein